MSKATATPFARTWQDINQSVNPRAMSKVSRQRRLVYTLKFAGIAGVLAIIVWGTVEIAETMGSNPNKLGLAESGPPLKDIALTTDGVLDHTWAERTLTLPKNATLMSLDLYALRTRLLAHGQVKAAVLTRNFPSTLAVAIQERSPVARVQVQVGDASPRALLVARDGVVFDGKNYDPALLGTLPWLDGVKLVHVGDGFAPIDGMDAVADLLATARNQAEHLYRTFEVISLARLASDGELVVRSKDIPEITFNTRDDFFRQLARLDYVLDLARAQPDKPLKSIDLANGLQVPVTIDTVARLQNSASASAPGAGLFPLPNSTHIAQRDF
ncbi:MAG TPA: FtsQ-type POTRA domain-containing protein [Opitutaceae bacterium]|nr:FtsQ-type POTRA domain-containing protein [Opitutaceae bacterium]